MHASLPSAVADPDNDLISIQPEFGASAVKWCRHATEYEQQAEGKPWQYALIPHDAITSTATFPALINQYSKA